MPRYFYYLFLLCVAVFILCCDSGTETSTLLSYINNPRLSSDTRIFDSANLIKQKIRLNARLKKLYDSDDIDMIVVTVPDLQGNNIDDIAGRILTSWKIGENSCGQKGILFLLSVKDELIRFKVGYDLKWIYTDSFVEYIERDKMPHFFQKGRIQEGIAAALETIIARADEEMETTSLNIVR